MNNRLRVFAAWLVLLTLSASVVEGAWAAACAGIESPRSEAAVEHGAGSSHSSDGRHTPAEGDSRSHSAPHTGTCPMPMPPGTACGTAALPVPALSVPLRSQTPVLIPPAADEAPRSLALSSLFRPPRR